MPKQKITKEMILSAAFDIVRTEGLESLLVKNIAAKLDCSVQPIYSYFVNMEDLKRELVEHTAKFIKEYIAKHIDKENYFKSMGNAHLKFAKEEPNLFRLYFLRHQSDIHSLQDLYNKESTPQVSHFIAKSLNVSVEKARVLHLHMIIYAMGVSAMAASSNIDIASKEVQDQLDSAYHAFLSQLKGETNE